MDGTTLRNNMIGRIAFGGRIMNDLNLDPRLPHSQLSSAILGSCFEVMNELGIGFLESVYKNALFFALKEKGLLVEAEKSFEVYFKRQKVGLYKADIVVENLIVIELKCCKNLLPEHQAQVINYLVVSNLPVGLLVNFNNKQLDYKRLHHPMYHPAAKGDLAYPVIS
jgi:GxxExxY protein